MCAHLQNFYLKILVTETLTTEYGLPAVAGKLRLIKAHLSTIKKDCDDLKELAEQWLKSGSLVNVDFQLVRLAIDKYFERTTSCEVPGRCLCARKLLDAKQDLDVKQIELAQYVSQKAEADRAEEELNLAQEESLRKVAEAQREIDVQKAEIEELTADTEKLLLRKAEVMELRAEAEKAIEGYAVALQNELTELEEKLGAAHLAGKQLKTDLREREEAKALAEETIPMRTRKRDELQHALKSKEYARKVLEAECLQLRKEKEELERQEKEMNQQCGAAVLAEKEAKIEELNAEFERLSSAEDQLEVKQRITANQEKDIEAKDAECAENLKELHELNLELLQYEKELSDASVSPPVRNVAKNIEFLKLLKAENEILLKTREQLNEMFDTEKEYVSVEERDCNLFKESYERVVLAKHESEQAIAEERERHANDKQQLEEKARNLEQIVRTLQDT